MKKIILLALFLSILFQSGKGQTTRINAYSASDTLLSADFIKQESGGAYVVAGTIKMSSPAGIEVYLLKTDSTGNVIRAKRFGSPHIDLIADLLLTNNDESFIIGTINDMNNKLFVVRSDSGGNVIWSKIYNTLGFRVSSAVQAADGNILICCNTPQGYMIIKIDLSGTVIWAKEMTGATHCVINGICRAANNRFMVIGWSDINTGGNPSQLFVACFDQNGTVHWSNTYSSTTSEVGDKIVQAADGGYFAAGYYSGFGIYPIVMKIDTGGNVQWGRYYEHMDLDLMTSITALPDNGFCISVSSLNPSSYIYMGSFIIKADSAGITEWKKSFVDYNAHTASGYLFLNSSNELIVSGGMEDTVTPGKSDILLGQGSTAGDFCLDTTFSTGLQGNYTFNKYPLALSLTPVTIMDSAGLQSWNLSLQKSTLCDPSGVTEHAISASEIFVFPNPASGLVELQLPYRHNLEKYQLEIFNVQGSLMLQKQITGTNSQLDISHFASGIYLLKITTDEKTEVIELIKE